MNKKYKPLFFTSIVLVVLGIVGGMIALIITGNGGFAPLMIPAGMIILIAICLPIWYASAKAQMNQDTTDEKAKEEAAVEKIQSTRTIPNKFARAQHEMENIVRMKGTVTKRSKIWTIIALSLIAASLILVVVGIILLITKGIFIPVVIGAGGFVITIATSLICMSAAEKASMKKLTAEEIATSKMEGEVVGCAASSTSMVGTDFNGKHISTIVYRVKLVSNGNEYIAFSETFYNTGDKVAFVPRRHGSAVIIEEKKNENQVETTK